MEEEPKPYTYKQGLSPSTFLEDMEKIPAFMTQVPEGQLPELVEALQSLKYSEDDPDECAENYKEDGNVNFKRKKFPDALACYTKALEMKITKTDLKPVLLFNRAATHYQMKNYRRCISDCEAALLLDPAYVKAVLKGAQALHAIGKFSESLQWLDRGLLLDPTNESLINLRKTVQRDEKKQLLKQRQQKKQGKQNANLLKAITDRNIRLHPPNPFEGDQVAKTPSGQSVTLLPDGALAWPIRLLFPEVNQQDFLEQVDETSTGGEILRMVLDDNPPEWDTAREYDSQQARCFFCDDKQMCVYQIDNGVEVREVLRHKEFVVEHAMPVLFVLSVENGFAQRYLKKFDRIIKLRKE
ncbi:tetratricopeptide repeat protein 4-like [Paramacrobiotus metropolitanus]|uniref:tetratricopeptide repeat protein 4-like n=1 Tax=Paramacrobiotus metropolitanus TaxID=2943436 RepID=UPI002446592D|nr:tetratricopeptide repeat protein 4-like [Paramacrobiotus metropolitanus]